MVRRPLPLLLRASRSGRRILRPSAPASAPPPPLPVVVKVPDRHQRSIRLPNSSRSLRPGLADDLGERRADHRMQAGRIESHLGRAPQLIGDAALDEVDAETPLVLGARGRTAAFPPLQEERPAIAVAFGSPLPIHASCAIGE